MLFHAWCNELSSSSRYSPCQLHGTECSFRLAMNSHGKIHANISLYLDGEEVVLGVDSGTNRFKQADQFCKSHSVESTSCAPMLGQKIGNALYCNLPRYKYRFKFIRSIKYAYSVEFDLIREILVNDFGWIECDEDAVLNLNVYIPNIWIFDASLNFVPNYVNSNILDRILTKQLGNKLVLRNHLNENDLQSMMPNGYNSSFLLSRFSSKERLESFFNSESILWILKDPSKEGGSTYSTPLTKSCLQIYIPSNKNTL